MRRAIVALGVSAVLVAGVGAGAYAAGTATGGMHDRMTTTDMGAMHASMHGAMPADMAQACDAAHNPDN